MAPREKPDWWHRFWAKVSVRPWDCWEWQASLRKDGYGRFMLDREAVLAHRVCYARLIGEVPIGLVLDHLCRNRRCVNPDHLEPVSERINILRGAGPAAINARKTHCPKGHPFCEGNLYLSGRKRKCKKCALMAWRKSEAVKSQAEGKV